MTRTQTSRYCANNSHQDDCRDPLEDTVRLLILPSLAFGNLANRRSVNVQLELVLYSILRNIHYAAFGPVINVLPATVCKGLLYRR